MKIKDWLYFIDSQMIKQSNILFCFRQLNCSDSPHHGQGPEVSDELFHQAFGGRRPLRWPHQRPHRHHLEDHHLLGGRNRRLQTHPFSAGAV